MAVRLPILVKGTAGMDVNFDITGSGVTSGSTTTYNVELGSTVQFTDSSTNSPTKWHWDFGDGTTSSLQNPTKIYTDLAASRNVLLMAANATSGGYEYKTNFIAVITSSALLLDTYNTNQIFGFSLRKIRTAYSGNCLRVRRASDNAETDIGFSAGLIDVSAIESFCAGTNGYVKVWYNQANSAQGNVEQTNPSSQPQIVSSGTIITNNFGNPAIQFADDGSTGLIDLIYNIDNQWLIASAFSNVASNQRMIQSNTTNSLISNMRGSNGVYNNGGFYHSTWGTANVAQVTTLSKNVDYMILKYNGTLLQQATLNTSNWGTLAIGKAIGNSEPSGGKVSELVVWDNPYTADQTDIATNLQSFWLV